MSKHENTTRALLYYFYLIEKRPSKCLCVGIKKFWNIYLREYYTAVKKSTCVKWVYIKNLLLNE